MFFILSKIMSPLLQPALHIALAVIVSFLMLCLGKTKGTKMMLSYAVFVLFVFGIMPTGYNMTVYLESRYSNTVINDRNPPYGIIVMGGAMNEILTTRYGQVVGYDSLERMTTFLKLARRFEHNNTKLVFTGGSAELTQDKDNPSLSESEAAALFFIEQGFPQTRIIYEGDSRTTYENVLNSKALLAPKAPQRWIVITSAFHMPRTQNVFQKMGWHIAPYAVDYRTDLKYKFMPSLDILKNLNFTQIAIHEWTGNAIYYLSGKSASFLP